MDLTFILTEACNLRCRYCYQHTFRPSAMPVPAALRAVKSAIRAGHRSLSITFFGGEPLLETERLLEILTGALRIGESAGVAVTAKVATNGLLLTQPFVDQAGSLGLFVSLSMDGVQAAHDQGRVTADGRGSFPEAARALDLLVDAGRPFAVYSVVTPANVGYLAESCSLLWQRGARILITAIDYTAEWTDRAVRTLESQSRRVGRMYERLVTRREHFHIEPIDSRVSQRTRSGDWQRCAPGTNQVTVGPDGTLYACTEFFYRRLHALGDIEGWLDPLRVKAFRQAALGPPPAQCGRCGIADRCNHTCACVNLRTTGQASRPPASVCATERATIQSVDRLAARLYRAKTPQFLLRQYSCSYHLLSGIEKLLTPEEADHGSVESNARRL